MEKVYGTTGFRASENMNLEEYFQNYRVICPPPESSVIESFLNLTEDINLEGTGVDIGSLDTVCNPENLRHPLEPATVPMDIPEKLSTKTKFEDGYPLNANARRLNVIKAKESLELKWKTPEYKFSGKRFIKTSVVMKSDVKFVKTGPSSNYIYSIIIYKPASIHLGQRNSAEKLRFHYEIEALGTNLLSEVVDIMECISNSAIIKEVENTKVDLSQLQNPKKKYPSQTVFIDGVFYNDTRPEDAVDLSPEIIKWAKEKNIGKFTTAVMQETYLSSLTPRLGYPYVYVHQGDCEHIFVFSDARLIQNCDSHFPEDYPKIVSLNRSSNIMCHICSLKYSQWMVINCDQFPQERVYLCKECCDSYLYIDGEKKVTNFKLYPYFDYKKTKF